MALSQNSTILISDISTALSGKQDALGYVPIKSVNGTTADSSGNVAISVSAPVTSVNGMTGAVTISSVSSATTATKATTMPNVNVSITKASKFTLPSGGTWAYLYDGYAGSNLTYHGMGVKSGGTTITVNSAGTTYDIYLFTIRKS